MQRKRLILTLIIRDAGQKKGEEKAPPIDPTVQLGNQSAHWDIRQRRELRVGGGRGEAGIYSSCRHFCKLRAWWQLMRNVEDFDIHGLGARISKSPKRQDGVRRLRVRDYLIFLPDLGVYGLGQ